MLPQTLQRELTGIVGAGAATPDPEHLAGGMRPAFAVRPSTEEQVSDILSLASGAGLGVCPAGGGTKLEWGNRPRSPDLLLSLRELDGITDLDPQNLTVTVRAGTPVAEVLRAAADAGTLAPLDPEDPERATIGGVVATNDQGLRRVGYGGLRDLVLGMRVMLADGSAITCGGRTMKNVTGYDLTKAFVGSHGTLGVITETTIRLLPRPMATGIAVLRPASLDEAADLCARVLASSLSPVALEVLSPETAAFVDDAATRLLFGTAGSEHGGGLVLLAGFDGHPAAVGRSLDDVIAAHRRVGIGTEAQRGLQASADGRRAETATDPAIVRSLYQALGGCRARARGAGLGVVAKATVPLTASWQVADAARREAARGHVRAAFRIGAGSGAVTLYLDPSDPLRCAELLLRLRRMAVAAGGHLVVVQGVTELDGGLDVWGDAGDSLPVMRALKTRLDPEGTLNPGRFVGGI